MQPRAACGPCLRQGAAPRALVPAGLSGQRGPSSRAIERRQQSQQQPVGTHRSATCASASSAAAAFPQQPHPSVNVARLQHLTKSVLVGVAAAAVWSIAASAFTAAASGGPLASMSLAVGGASSAGTGGATRGVPRARRSAPDGRPRTHALQAGVPSSQPLPRRPLPPPPAAAQEAAKSGWAGLAAGFLHTLCGPDHLAVSAARKFLPPAAACCVSAARFLNPPFIASPLAHSTPINILLHHAPPPGAHAADDRAQPRGGGGARRAVGLWPLHRAADPGPRARAAQGAPSSGCCAHNGFAAA